MQHETPSHSASKNGQLTLLQAFKDHQYSAELTSYCSLLVVGVTQIIIRENFPQIKPPWPWIGGALIVAPLGYCLIPPFIRVARSRRS